MKTTTKRVQKWIDLYVNRKMNVVEIARLYPTVSRSTIRKALVDNGVLVKSNIHHNKYYKKKYQIGIYDQDDNLLWLFDNAYEMADFFKISLSKVYRTLQPDHINHKWHIDGEIYNKVLLEVEDVSFL